jgi:membrane protein YdbS with pleckstrin-like domain
LEEFTNNPVSFETLPKFESVPLQPLNSDYLNVVYIGNSIFTILLSVGVLIFLWVKKDNASLILPVLAAYVLIIGLLFWLSNIGFRKKGYALREKDILFQKGILSTTTTVIPFSRIQHVALHEGFLSRMYHLSELQIYTAGGSSSDLHIPGLPKEQAEQMKTFLLQKITPIVEVSSVDSFSKEEEIEKPAVASIEMQEEKKPLDENNGI